jgi:hypothetical protein
MATYVFPTIAQCATMITTFDLWMSRSCYYTFVLVINFINPSLAPCHIAIGLFEALDIFGATLTKQVKFLLTKFNLINKVIAYVKDEGANLSSLIISFTFVVSCELLQLTQPFVSLCFGHVMSKAW